MEPGNNDKNNNKNLIVSCQPKKWSSHMLQLYKVITYTVWVIQLCEKITYLSYYTIYQSTIISRLYSHY